MRYAVAIRFLDAPHVSEQFACRLLVVGAVLFGIEYLQVHASLAASRLIVPRVNRDEIVISGTLPSTCFHHMPKYSFQ